MNMKKKNILSTAFLVLSLIVAGGFAVDTFSPQQAKANVNPDLEICSTGPACVGPPVNCYCEVVITPEQE
ncbi:hypothetical protein BSZ35_13325 [Salinibacter sp. 10B]|nr:hypothetical protein BSZ35_13325 [Salinibacter sp. 10B]